jgi:hypothetical protein
MTALHEFYGEKNGEKEYMKMLAENKKPFRKGMNTAEEHGHLKVYKIKHSLWNTI